jgi:hypothetical protein
MSDVRRTRGRQSTLAVVLALAFTTGSCTRGHDVTITNATGCRVEVTLIDARNESDSFCTASAYSECVNVVTEPVSADGVRFSFKSASGPTTILGPFRTADLEARKWTLATPPETCVTPAR